MSNGIRTRSSSLVLTLCLVVAAAPPLWAQFGTGSEVIGPMRTLQGDDDRQPARAGDRTTERRQQAQDVIQESARQLDETLVGVLEMVNRQEKPTPEQIENYKAAYEAAKKYTTRFDDGLQCETFMLQAWTDYFAKNVQQAYLAAKRACETDRANRDANATQAAMSILLGRAPDKIEPRRTRTTTGRGGQDSYVSTQNARASQIGVRASSGNILQLDVDAIDASLLGKPVGAMKLTCFNATTLDYDPSRSNLCILFWQLGANAADASGEPNNVAAQPGRLPSRRPTPQNVNDSRNPDPRMVDRGRPDARQGGAYDDSGRTNSRQGGAYDDSGRRDPSYDSYNRGPAAYDEYGYAAPGGQQPGAQLDPLVVETGAYGRLFGSYLGNPQVTFVSVNTDPLASAPAAVKKILENPWPWANVMAAAPGSGAAQFADLSPARPTLAIVNAGKIQYAGPAAGFLAPMVLEHLAGQPAAAGVLAPPANAAAPANPLLSPLKNLLGGVPGNPTAPTPPPAVLPGGQAPSLPAANQGDEESELTPENYEAGKKLEYARGLFIPAGRKNFLTSKRGVDLCREIIREYPNTKYAQEARLLLRQVPENERKRYSITNEEMGL